MKKELIISHLKKTLNKQLVNLKATVKKEFNYAHSEELKAESKYDTRKTEANYLAFAQKKRLDKLISDITKLDKLKLSQKINEVQLGSLCQFKSNQEILNYFISPTDGMGTIVLKSIKIKIISINSPIAKASMGLIQDDCFEVILPKKTFEYIVININ